MAATPALKGYDFRASLVASKVVGNALAGGTELLLPLITALWERTAKLAIWPLCVVRCRGSHRRLRSLIFGDNLSRNCFVDV